MFVDLDWPLNASSPLSASAELLVDIAFTVGWRNGSTLVLITEVARRRARLVLGWAIGVNSYWPAGPEAPLFEPRGSPILEPNFLPNCLRTVYYHAGKKKIVRSPYHSKTINDLNRVSIKKQPLRLRLFIIFSSYGNFDQQMFHSQAFKQAQIYA